jgi:hypothetical protein
MKKTLIALLLALIGIPWLVRSRVVHSQSSPPLDETTASVRVQFGVTDQEPTPWEGSISVSGGQVTTLRHWHPRPGDRIDGTARFALATRKGVNFVKRPWEVPYPEPQRDYLLIPGLIVDVKGPPTARIRFETAHGSFEVTPSALEAGRAQRHLGGRVVVDRVPLAQTVSSPGTNADFAAALAHPSGELWVAWVTFAAGKDEVTARRFDGRQWEPARRVSVDHGDIFLVKIARDRNGHVWFVWSAQVGGNWDLYARKWDGAAWSVVERLTQDPQPDVYHVAAADSRGSVWVAWQGFRNGKSDIFVRRFDGSSWSAEERVSTSPANDWQPALAADRKGSVYVGWDTYDKGHYDAMVRKFDGSRWAEAMPVAATPRYEAYITLACDSDDRLWAAWNEAGFEWGKDTGFLVKQEGTPLYRDRWIGVAVLEGSVWKQPASDLERSLPETLRRYNDLPQLVSDGAGRMWLTFRHRMLRIRDLPADTPAHRAAWEIFAIPYQGSRWGAVVAMPFSNGRQDMRAGLTSGAPGTLYAAYPTDRRDFEDFLYQRAEVVATRMPSSAVAGAPPVLSARAEGKLSTPLIHAEEARDLTRIRGEAWPLDGKTYRIYRGDTHRHTEFSMDGNNDGSLLDTYRYAIDAASLDYLMVSEHNGLAGPDQEYINWLLQQMADVFTLHGTFLPLYGYERSVGYPNGHRNVIFTKRGNPTLPIPPEEQKAQTGARMLYDYLKKYNGIAISHTSASNMGTDWRDNDPEVEPLVEIYQGDRVSNEYEGAPKAAYTANPGSAPGGFRPAGYVWNAWKKGYKLGVQVSSDHLSTHISYACTIASDFTRDGLMEAMKLRHSYGATDNIVLDYRVETGGRQYLQGEQIKLAGPLELVVNVKGTKPVRQVDLVRDNEFIHTRHPLQQDVSFRFRDTRPVTKESYYYVRVIQVDDQMAWSSPVWVRK